MHPTAGEIAALQSEVAALRATLAEKNTLLADLQIRDAKLEQELTLFRGSIALASRDASPHRGLINSPSSTLDWTGALRAATAATFMVRGSAMLTVMPTGSMEPMFNERAILLIEPARFEDLKVGDVVTYRHPQFNMVVVHRILEKHGDKFWSKGDHNGRMDQVYITRENYEARVFGIIYARESPTQTRNLSECLAASSVITSRQDSHALARSPAPGPALQQSPETQIYGKPVPDFAAATDPRMTHVATVQ